MKAQDIDQWSMPFASHSMKNGLDWIKHKPLNPNLRILICNLLNSVEDTIPNLPVCAVIWGMLSDTICQLWAWPCPSLRSPSLISLPWRSKYENATIPLSYGKAEFDMYKHTSPASTHDATCKEFLNPSHFCITLLSTHLHHFTFSISLKWCFLSSFKLFMMIHILLINSYSPLGGHLLPSSSQPLITVFIATVGETHI